MGISKVIGMSSGCYGRKGKGRGGREERKRKEGKREGKEGKRRGKREGRKKGEKREKRGELRSNGAPLEGEDNDKRAKQAQSLARLGNRESAPSRAKLD